MTRTHLNQNLEKPAVSQLQYYGYLMRESRRNAYANPVASIVTLLLIAGMCIAVLLTSGRAAGAQQAVLGTLDEAGTRTIVVTSDKTDGIPNDIVQKLKDIQGIDWAVAMGPSVDVSNSAIPGGIKQSLSHAWATNWIPFGINHSENSPEVGIASNVVTQQLGFIENFGTVGTQSGEKYSVTGTYSLPVDGQDSLTDIIVPQQSASDPDSVQKLVIVANSPASVRPITELVTSFIAPSDASTVHVQTSQRLAELRAVVDDQLVVFGRVLTLGILAVASTLVGIVSFGLILLRRKEFGRRRALGASRRIVVALVLLEAATVSAVGALIGETTAASLLTGLGDPMPPPTFMLGIGVLAIFVGVVASLIPAFFAARREPIVELRVP
ncbi:ABC transporter permease [Arthrobacter sp. GMC3]|uniref:ABC transporter permease n=1 Tax=Arthrobacter sp. GMC3 TaxID=2058894 RepID=UPI000CE48FEF|nr:ABC transporter permease [Arthrobacter sp. GMC3]